ncbi:MAG: hypothetical protein P1R58_07590 [bacterium]|nr:hypothetical protein [bacterium]
MSNTLKRDFLSGLFFLLLAVSSVNGQDQMKGLERVEQFRSPGEIRYWSIEVKDSVVGGLRSEIGSPIKIDGQNAFVFGQKLDLDFSKVGQNRRQKIEGDFFVNSQGRYLGDSKSIGIDSLSEQLELRRQGDSITGYFTRGGSQVRQNSLVESDRFAFDLNFYDELELILAMSDLKVGEHLEAKLMEPQTMLKAQLTGFVEDFVYINIYGKEYDSVFLINIFTPQNMFALFTRDRRLVKVDIPDQKTKVYQDLVKKQQQVYQPPSFGLIHFIRLIPNYAAFLIVSILSCLLFIGRGYRWKVSYLSYLSGVSLFWLAVVTQFPLQEWIFKEMFIPSVRSGGSIFMAGLLPALPVGLIQTAIVSGALLMIQKSDLGKRYQLPILGAVFGAGFAMMEAAYLDSLVFRTGFDLGLLERISIILFHAAMGSLIGYFLAFNRRQLWLILLVAVLLNSFYRYLPIFVQSQSMSISASAIIMFCLGFGVQVAGTIVQKQKLFRSGSEPE